jgi:hypothetical protein
MTEKLDEQARWVLGRAADYITRRGWCRFEWFDLHGRACVGGAVHTFAPSPDVERRALELVERTVGERWDRWQDAPERTRTQVLEALHRAARVPALV